MASDKLLPKGQFVRLAILRLRTGKSKGIHTVFSGFNNAYRAYYVGADPVKDTKALVAQGKFEGHAVTGGFMLYIKGEMPKGATAASPDKVLGTLNAILAK